MQKEMTALVKNNTCNIVKVPEEAHLVGCKWIYTIKDKSDGTIECYKACRLAKAFNKKYSSHLVVMKMNIVQIILAAAMTKEWQLDLLVIKYVFLNGNLQ